MIIGDHVRGVVGLEDFFLDDDTRVAVMLEAELMSDRAVRADNDDSMLTQLTKSSMSRNFFCSN